MTVSFDWIISLFRSELGAGAPNIAKLSITLGVLELSHTAKEQTACQINCQVGEICKICLWVVEGGHSESSYSKVNY